MGTKITYTEAFEELQQIVNELENSEVSIDKLEQRIKRASTLLKLCREKLYKAEHSVAETLKNLEVE